MLKHKLPVLGILLCLPFLSFSNTISKAKVKFYSADVTVEYDREMFFKFRTCTRDKCLKDFFEKMEQTNYKVLLDDLLKHKEGLQLNDWFFYTFVRKSVEKIYAQESQIYHTLVCWFLFTKAGYDTHLNTAVNQFLFLNVATTDRVYEAPFSRYENKIYINLTALYFGLNTRRALYEIPAYKPETGGKLFSFDIGQLPNIPSRIIKKNVRFKFDNQSYSFELEIDTMARALMRNYPILNDESYFEVAPSIELQNSLLSQLRPHLAEKSEKEKVEFLVSFTRTAFKYKIDEEIYRHNRPMIPEELFLHEYSDHEDRCALFYYLMKELTTLDMIVIRYYEVYKTIAVALPEAVGKPIVHNGINYFVCDPTVPNNSKSIGKFPPGLTDETLEVVGR